MKIIGTSDQGFIVHATAREINLIAGRDPSYRRNEDDLAPGKVLDVASGWESMRAICGTLNVSRQNVVLGLRAMADRLDIKPTAVLPAPPEGPIETPPAAPEKDPA